jgi:hypothetical protein
VAAAAAVTIVTAAVTAAVTAVTPARLMYADMPRGCWKFSHRLSGQSQMAKE